MSGCGTLQRYRIPATILQLSEEWPRFGWCNSGGYLTAFACLFAHVTGAAELQRRLGSELPPLLAGSSRDAKFLAGKLKLRSAAASVPNDSGG